MIQIDLQSRVPIYEQVIKGIIRLRALGILGSNEKLPSVRALANELVVNPNTVAKAYSQLESDGIIYTVSGKGSFISPSEKADNKILSDASFRLKAALRDALNSGMNREMIMNILKDVLSEGGDGGDD